MNKIVSIFIVSVVLLTGSCQKSKRIDNGLGVGFDLGYSQQKADAIVKGLELLKPHVAMTGHPLHDSMTWAAGALAQTELPVIAKKFAELGVKITKLNDRNLYLEDHYKNDFFSQRQKRWAWAFFWIWVGLGVGAAVFGMMGGVAGGPIWLWLSSFIIRLIPGANLFAKVRDVVSGTHKVAVKTKK